MVGIEIDAESKKQIDETTEGYEESLVTEHADRFAALDRPAKE